MTSALNYAPFRGTKLVWTGAAFSMTSVSVIFSSVLAGLVTMAILF